MSLALYLFAASVSATTGELLLNPSFEELDGDKPAHWELFVEPMEGARGAVDTQASDGKLSVMLHNPARYAEEPANNWSQNVLAPLGGQTLSVTGSIKTQGADEAALWIQCYRKKPWALLEQRSSSEETSVRGDMDWTPVSMRVNVPRGTDFVVLRCVLKGKGTAWFDHLSMTAKENAPATQDIGQKVPSLPKSPEMPSVPHIEVPTPPHIGEEGLGGGPTQVPDESMRKATESLRKTNEQLQEQIKSMKHEIDQLREQTRRIKEEVKSETSESRPETEKPVLPPVPPLVPHENEAKEKP